MKNWKEYRTAVYDPWVVDGVVTGLTVLWGAPGVGKTFVAVSVAASVATGRPWLGRRCLQGDVVYVCGEGGFPNLARRIQAALTNVGVDWLDMYPEEYYGHDEELWSPEFPIHIADRVDLVAGPAPLIAAIGDKRPRLIIIDTLSRCFSGDENKQEFMQKFVQSLDLLRETYPGVAILVLHHANKNHDLRGSTVLAGACDASFKMSYGRGADAKILRVLTPDKLREREVDGAAIWLRLEQCEVDDTELLKRPDGGLQVQVEKDDVGRPMHTVVTKPTVSFEADVRKAAKAGRFLGGGVGEFSFDQWYTSATEATKLEVGVPGFKALVQAILAEPDKYGILPVYEEDPKGNVNDETGEPLQQIKRGWYRTAPASEAK